MDYSEAIKYLCEHSKFDESVAKEIIDFGIENGIYPRNFAIGYVDLYNKLPIPEFKSIVEAIEWAGSRETATVFLCYYRKKWLEDNA